LLSASPSAPNSQCRIYWRTLNNNQASTAGAALDPACYQIVTVPSKNYADAQARCEAAYSSLASIKDSSSEQFIVQLMAQYSIPDRVYIGIPCLI